MKINTKYILLIFCWMIVFFSCQQDGSFIEPNVYNEDPVFSIQGALDQSPINIEAGVNGYYLFTDYFQEGQAYVFTGKFSSEDANVPVASDLNFYLRTDVDPNSTFSIDDLLQVGAQDYLRPDNSTDSFRYTFSTDYLDSSANAADFFNWEFSFGETAIGETVELVRPDSLPFQVALNAGNNICSSSFTSMISPSLIENCEIDLEYEWDTLNALLTINITHPDPLGATYLWSNNTSTSSEATYEFSQLTTTGFEIEIIVSNNYGCSTTANIAVAHDAAALSPNVCATLFYAEVEQIAAPNYLTNSTIVIEYIVDGKPYRSDWGVQPSDSFFDILEIEEFSRNENGLPTKMLNVKFETILFNPAGEAIPFSGEGIIGVAYPE